MLVNAKKLLLKARKNQQAIPAFNVSSLEALQAVFEAASQENYPIIIETSKGEMEHLTPELLAAICQQLSAKYKVDYALHMDRCSDFEIMQRVLKAGYNSISAEFGETDYQKNLAKTKRARQLTNQYNAQLEGVMEVVPMVYYQAQENTKYTDPALAQEFVLETQCDSLVVSIGTQSGKFKTSQRLRHDILKEINQLLPQVPFVLHGGSFLSPEIIKQIIPYGVAKININSELRIVYTQRLKNNLNSQPEEYAPYRLLIGVREEIKKIARQKIRIFRS